MGDVAPEGRMAGEDVEARGQPLQDAGRPPGDLRANLHAVAQRFLGDVVHLVALVGAGRGCHQGDRQVGLVREALDPHPLVVVAEVVGDHLEHAVLQPLHRQAQRQHLVGAGEGAWHVHALQILVQQRPGGREAERAGLDAFAHQLGHLGDLVGGGLVVGVAALAEHIGAHRGVRDVHADVDRALLGLQRVEVFGEASPTSSRCPRPAPSPGCPRPLPSAR